MLCCAVQHTLMVYLKVRVDLTLLLRYDLEFYYNIVGQNRYLASTEKHCDSRGNNKIKICGVEKF